MQPSTTLELVPIEKDAEAAKVAQVFAPRGTEPVIPLAIARSIAHFAPPQSFVHAQLSAAEEETACLRADLAYNEMKRSGELLRREIQRAQDEERRWGVL